MNGHYYFKKKSNSARKSKTLPTLYFSQTLLSDLEKQSIVEEKKKEKQSTSIHPTESKGVIACVVHLCGL